MGDVFWPNGTKSKPYVSSPFGRRVAPVAGASTNHKGTDFSHTFSLIRAVADGVVHVAGTRSGWTAGGQMVWVQHDGFFSRSLHMSSVAVRAGQRVTAGTVLGVMGKTGTATDIHLHFEITPGVLHYSNTGQIDPVVFLTNRIASPAGGGSSPGTSEEDDMFTDDDREDIQSIKAALFGPKNVRPPRPQMSWVNPDGQREAFYGVLDITIEAQRLAGIAANKPVVSDAQVKQIADLVKAAIGKPTATVDYAAIAKAVNDDAARRMAS